MTEQINLDKVASIVSTFRFQVKRMLEGIFPALQILKEAIEKTGMTAVDAENKTQAFFNAVKYFNRKVKKHKRRVVFLRKYHARGYRMKRNG